MRPAQNQPFRFVRSIKILAFFATIGIVILVTSYFYISLKSNPYIYTDTNKLPNTKVALLLGTSNRLKEGSPNPFFYNRIGAAVELYRKGKVKYFILSGDNQYMSYNEPIKMRNVLVRMGIPDSVLYLDFAGIRTFDSVVRCRTIFGQTEVLIISQNFHLQRAIYIARYMGMNAIGYRATGVGIIRGLKTLLREFPARLLVYWDLYNQTMPKYLGEKVNIP
ncbi:MAG TPA: ElyC/SanA/YdcF family protein [Bacteroidales bacterium]|nr:ElyC/SanA/YdcF family protein [Bacteroidales bacterium]